MSVRLRLRAPPDVRLDVAGLTPAALAPLARAAIEQLPLAQGRRLLPLAEFFDVAVDGGDADALVFDGDLARCDRVGAGLSGGRVVVDGSVGHHAGAAMTGGTLHVRGNAGLLCGCEMAGGTLAVDGDVGDFAAGALPGSLDGMRGGRLVVRGSAGERFGDRMRRGTALVYGDVGDFAASRLVAGTIAIGGRAGAGLGYGMRRGSVVCVGAQPAVAPTFVPALGDAAVFWHLVARDLALAGGPFADLPARPIGRYLGDVAADGQGELIVVGR